MGVLSYSPTIRVEQGSSVFSVDGLYSKTVGNGIETSNENIKTVFFGERTPASLENCDSPLVVSYAYVTMYKADGSLSDVQYSDGDYSLTFTADDTDPDKILLSSTTVGAGSGASGGARYRGTADLSGGYVADSANGDEFENLESGDFVIVWVGGDILCKEPGASSSSETRSVSVGDVLVYDGMYWTRVGSGNGGGSGGAVESVNGQTGAVVLTGADIATSAEDDKTVAESLAAKADEFTEWETDSSFPLEWTGNGWVVVVEGEHASYEKGDADSVDITWDMGQWMGNVPLHATRRRVLRTGDADKLTDEQKSVLAGGPYATEDQLRVTMQLVGNNPYAVQLDGETLTFAKIKAFAQTRNAVIQREEWTYRVTYIDANEMMWDVTGTIAGHVQTEQIHIFDQGGETVVQMVSPKELATKPMVDAVSDKVDGIKETVSTDNRFLVDGTTAAIQTRENETAEWQTEIRVDKGYDAVQGNTMVKLDKSVQTVTVSGGSLTVELPDAVEGTVRDLCLYVNNTSPTETVTMTFPAGVTVYKSKGGDDPKTAAQAGGITAYYFTEIPGGAWRVVRDELEVAT